MRKKMLWGLVFLFLSEFLLANSEEGLTPLVIRGDNTVIIDCGDPYASAYLQYFLLKYVAKDKDAENYILDAKPAPDRAAVSSFPVVGDVKKVSPEKVLILLGPVDGIPANFLTEADRTRLKNSRRNSILLVRTGNNIVLTKRDPDMWNLNHIRVFLDKCAGIRMYAPAGSDGLEWVSFPVENSFTVGKLEHYQQPYFVKATFSSTEKTLLWSRINCMVTEGIELRASHTIIRYFPPEKYYEKYPQLYPMNRAGQRPKPSGYTWNPCLADSDLAAKIALEELRNMNPKGYASFGIMDCAYDCQCPVCQDSLRKHQGNAGYLWFTFLNKVAREAAKEFPGLYLTTYAYSNVGAPGDMKLEPNIIVDNVIKSYRYTEPAYREGMEKEILSFAELGAGWVTHDWNFQGITPRIYTRSLAALLQWGVRNGMKGILAEWTPEDSWYLAGVHYWVLRQLISDPFQDPDVFWMQYCQDMFGPAWERMYRFYDLFQQKHIVGDAFYVRADWPRQEVQGFDEEDIQMQRKWLQEAINLTKDDPLIQKRLKAIERYFHAHELLVKAVSLPGRLYHRYTVLEKKTGINRDALAFYVNDDGSRLMEFERYYDTIENPQDRYSGVRFSYRNNYSRALGTIVNAVREKALGKVNLERINKSTIGEIYQSISKIFRENLPSSYNQKRCQEIEKLMKKIVLVPGETKMPVIDGDISDPVWSKAAVLDGFTLADIFLPSQEGNHTEGKIMRVNNHLVLSLVCQQPGGIWAATPPEVQTGTSLWRESSCEIFFSPYPVTDEKDYCQYVVNSLGAYRGWGKAKDNRQGVQCAVKLAPDRKTYIIEVALPLAVEGLYDYSRLQVLSFNIMRNPYTANTFNPRERIGWAPIFLTAHLPESRGLLLLEAP